MYHLTRKSKGKRGPGTPWTQTTWLRLLSPVCWPDSQLVQLVLLHAAVRSREGNGNPLQYSCLENPLDRGTWLATVHGVTGLDSTERLSLSHTHTHTHSNEEREGKMTDNLPGGTSSLSCPGSAHDSRRGLWWVHLGSTLTPVIATEARIVEYENE